MVGRIQRFQVVAPLGAGGMGMVYRARDPQLEREVAIKVLSGASAAAAADLSANDTIDLRTTLSPTSQDDLLREARLMALVSHPNVLPVYEAGLADGAVFVVMELIDGCDLAWWLSEPRATGAILDVFAQAAAGLRAAHERGIVHRDFKPHNVLISSDGRARVADFGLSRLGGRGAAMVTIDDGRGTPRYMAPELWRGGAATFASDVYALCTALDEALGGQPGAVVAERQKRWRERGLSPALRAVLAAGLDDDPVCRPTLAAVLTALRPGGATSARAWALGALAVAAVGAGIATATAIRSDDLACDPDLSQLARVWNAERRAVIGDKLMAAAAPDARDVVVATLANLDEDRAAIQLQLDRLCADLRARIITRAQAALRRSCLERRVFEFDALTARFAEGVYDARNAHRRSQGLAEVGDCLATTAPALPADPTGVRALHARYVAAHELAIPSKAKEHLEELVAIEAEAMRVGELELAARTAVAQSFEQRFQGENSAADEALVRAYKLAIAIGAPDLAIDAMIERSFVAALRNDPPQALGFAERARELADRPTTSVRTRVRVHAGYGRALMKTGDFKGAIAELERGLDVQRASGKRSRVEINLRFALINSLLSTEGRIPDAVRVARDTVGLVRELDGEAHANNGVALNMLAEALAAVDDRTGALAARRQGLAIMRANLPAGSPRIAPQRLDLLPDLRFVGDYATVRAEAIALLDEAEHAASVGAYRAHILRELAIATFHTGRHAEGLRILAHARDETISRYGLAHKDTLVVREIQLQLQLELGSLDAADRSLAELEQAFQASAEDREQRLAHVRGVYGTTLAVAHGRASEGERMARDALRLWTETKGRRLVRIDLLMALAEALAAQQRWPDARPVVDEALELAAELALPAHLRAVIEISSAHVDAKLGRAGALERARAAREVLDGFPGYLRARREADALLATSRRRGTSKR